MSVILLCALLFALSGLIAADPEDLTYPAQTDEQLARYANLKEPDDFPVPISIDVAYEVREEAIHYTYRFTNSMTPEADDRIVVLLNGEIQKEVKAESAGSSVLQVAALGNVSFVLALLSSTDEVLAISLETTFLFSGAGPTQIAVDLPQRPVQVAPLFEIVRRKSPVVSTAESAKIFSAWIHRHEVFLDEERGVAVPTGRIESPTVLPNGGTFSDEVVITLTCSAAKSIATFAEGDVGPFRAYVGPFLWTRRGETVFRLACTTGEEDSAIVTTNTFIITDGQKTRGNNLGASGDSSPDLILSVATRKWLPLGAGLYQAADGDREKTLAAYSVFGGSLRRCGFDGDVVVGVAYRSPADTAVGELVDEISVRQTPWDDYIFEGQMNNITSVFWLRYFFYLHFLEANWESYRDGFVILSDFRDVYFQRDPFNFLRRRKDADSDVELYFFQESIGDAPATLENETFIGQANSYWLEACYGPTFVVDHHLDPVTCSGVVIGTAHAIHTYLRDVTSQFLDLRRRQTVWCHSKVGSDQGVHNYLFMDAKLHHRYKLFRNDIGMVKTVGTSPTLRNHIGLVLNEDGSVPSIVHQYDRIPELNHTVQNMFPYFYDASILQQPKEQFMIKQ